ncbi:MAG: DUF2203 domain-containing protein [Chloroflexales bacterium]|nr:DUF2203 domain-containing protein [Chloroflexales bacterium]
MTTHDELVTQRDEATRLQEYYKTELERQRAMNAELRKAVADMARTFQETLAEAVTAADSGDLVEVRRIAYANRSAWQAYLQHIVTAAKASSSKPE